MSFLVGDLDRIRLSRDYERRRRRRRQDLSEPDPSPTFGDGDDTNDRPAPGIGFPQPPGKVEEEPCPASLVDWSNWSGATTTTLTPEEFGAAIIDPEFTTQEGKIRRHSQALVLHGLPQAYVKVLFACKALGISSRFLEAHAERRGYNSSTRWSQYGVRVEQWEYPEVVGGFTPPTGTIPQGTSKHGADLMTNAKVYPIGTKGLAVVFCRASWWEVEGCRPLLLLDRGAWGQSATALLRAQWRVSITGSGLKTQTDGAPIDLFQERLLRPPLDTSPDDKKSCLRRDALVAIAYDCWLDFFDFMDMSAFRRLPRDETMGFYRQLLHSLELNQHATQYIRYYWSQRPHSEVCTHDELSFIDWPHIYARANNRIALLSKESRGKAPALFTTGSVLTTSSARCLSNSKKPNGSGTVRTMGTGTLPPGRIPGRNDRDSLDENHRALDRVSYLGGVLIPLPVVSGILSMGETFGPDGSKFFIFWAISIPLCIVTVLIIYADTIRKAEVWVEVAAEHAVPAPDAGEADGTGGAADQEQPSWRRHKKTGSGGKTHLDDEEAQVSLEGPGMLNIGLASMPPGGKLSGETNINEEEEEEEEVTLPVLLSLRPGLQGLEQEQELPEVILENPIRGRKQRAWQRKKLGWAGAAKAILYQKPHYCRHGVPEPEGMPSYDRRTKRTRTF